MLLNARRIEEDDRTGLILLALEDITDRKRAAEARYRRLFEAAKDGMMIADADTGEITDANPFLERLSGYPARGIRGQEGVGNRASGRRSRGGIRAGADTRARRWRASRTCC